MGGNVHNFESGVSGKGREIKRVFELVTSEMAARWQETDGLRFGRGMGSGKGLGMKHQRLAEDGWTLKCV
jgi:hypothetical protein